MQPVGGSGDKVSTQLGPIALSDTDFTASWAEVSKAYIWRLESM